MAFFTEVSTAIAADIVAKKALKIPALVKKIAKDSKERLSDGSLGIFIFGPQGTGKTTLLGVISGKKEINDVPTQYESSSKNEYNITNDNIYFKAFAGPGQDYLRNIHWPDLYEKMSKFSRIICVFCVSYGCHAIFEEGMAMIEADTINVNERLMVQEYLQKKRVEESKLFKAFCERLKTVRGRLGLMVLVTKQDLWWGERAEVKRHYARGQFAKSLKELQTARNATGLVTGTQSVSLSLQNLLTSDNALLVPTTQGYDQLLQRANFELFNGHMAKMAAMLIGK